MIELLREFRPALLFLGKFLAIYFAGNVLYGLFIESYGNLPDPLTRAVTRHTSCVLNIAGENTSFDSYPENQMIALRSNGETVVNVFEGCNGVNVVIIFAAFLIAFGGSSRALWWFLPSGVALLHLINLARISLLYFVALHRPADFYYLHKYFFTVILYAFVFGLWAIWVLKFQPKSVENASA